MVCRKWSCTSLLERRKAKWTPRRVRRARNMQRPAYVRARHVYKHSKSRTRDAARERIGVDAKTRPLSADPLQPVWAATTSTNSQQRAFGTKNRHECTRKRSCRGFNALLARGQRRRATPLKPRWLPGRRRGPPPLPRACACSESGTPSKPPPPRRPRDPHYS